MVSVSDSGPADSRAGRTGSVPKGLGVCVRVVISAVGQGGDDQMSKPNSLGLPSTSFSLMVCYSCHRPRETSSVLSRSGRSVMIASTPISKHHLICDGSLIVQTCS